MYKCGNVIRLKLKNGDSRVWIVVGNYIGSQTMESLVGLKSLDLVHQEKETKVPVEFLEQAGVEKINLIPEQESDVPF